SASIVTSALFAACLTSFQAILKASAKYWLTLPPNFLTATVAMLQALSITFLIFNISLKFICVSCSDINILHIYAFVYGNRCEQDVNFLYNKKDHLFGSLKHFIQLS